MSALPAGAKARFFLDVERSVCGRAWHDRLDDRASARALSIVQRHGMPELLARVLAARDVAPEDVEAFLDPTVKRLMPDPDRLIDMGAAAARIADAVTRGEQVAIFGDYDVDGATSAALLTRFLRAGGLDPIIHIPDRLFEGYGPNVEAVQSLAQRGARLLVAVDCGTTSHEPLETARRLGLDVVVIDHHLADERLPPALAVVNPNRLDDLSGLGHLAAVGLVFMTIVAVNRVLRTTQLLVGAAQRARPPRLPRPGGARHRGRRGGAERAQPRVRRQGPHRHAPPRGRRPHRADGRGAPGGPAGAVASRLPARAAHQRGRTDRPRRSRRRACS